MGDVNLLRRIYKREKINGKLLSLGIIFLLILGSFFGMLGTVTAPVGQSFNVWGTAYAGVTYPGIGVSQGSEVSGWIDGVCWGTATVATNNMFDLDVVSDAWGIPSADSVKDGGYEGDFDMFFLDYNPMDYYLNVSHTTFIHQEGGYYEVNPLFFNRTDLAPELTTLRLLKINEIVLDPIDGMSQYIILFDPGLQLGINKITDYYLQKDNNINHTTYGEIFDFLAHSSDIIDMNNGYYYINLTSDLELLNSDELKLIWKNPHTPSMNPALTGPGNGTDIVVDRVEWGNYTNDHAGDYSWRDYDNTTLLDFADVSSLVGTGSSMIRTDNKISPGYSGNGTDTDDCFEDFKVLTTATPRPPPFTGSVHNINSHVFFDTIQEAINDPETLNGHTITVAAGKYIEDVNINKSISLVGSYYESTMIQGTVILNKSSINLRNFKIENPGATSVLLIETTLTNLENLLLDGNNMGISCLGSNNVSIKNCLIWNNWGRGMEIKSGTSGHYPDNITIEGNNIMNNTYGIDLVGGTNCKILNNIISENRDYGLYISSSSTTKTYGNNFIKNNMHAYDDGINQWDNNYPNGGNFWSDYLGVDQFSGSAQDLPGNDDIGDTGYPIDGDSVDNYPLKSPCGNCTYLYEGWNFISLPFIQSDSDILTVLSSIGTSYNSVQTYNTSDYFDHWKHYNPSKPPHMNDLENIDHRIGFWTHVHEPEGVLLDYPGSQPTENKEITLSPGWNYVGYPSLSMKKRTEALNNIVFSTDVNSIWTYDPATQTWMELDEPTDSFVVGHGYWIHSLVTKIWTVPL